MTGVAPYQPRGRILAGAPEAPRIYRHTPDVVIDLHRGRPGVSSRRRERAPVPSHRAAGLSGHAAQALDNLADVLGWLEQRRDRLALRVWIEQGWLQLGGPESLTAARFLRDAQRFMQLLEEAAAELLPAKLFPAI